MEKIYITANRARTLLSPPGASLLLEGKHTAYLKIKTKQNMFEKRGCR